MSGHNRVGTSTDDICYNYVKKWQLTIHQSSKSIKNPTNMKKINQLGVILLCLSLLALTNYGCSTTKKATHAVKKTAKTVGNKVSKTVKNASKTVKGAVIGTSGGALAGAAIGKAAGNTVTGTIVGAAVGGTAGTLIGHHMDKEAHELNSQLKNAEVKRVGEGIKITFPSSILFDTNSSYLKSDAKQSIRNLSSVLKKYDNTKILFAGYTDSTGTKKVNQQLSKQRAVATALYAAKQGVDPERMIINGYGEQNPVADNSTKAGRQKNRRVEVGIYANKKLKKMAKKGEIGQNSQQ
jgi:outer membrane protein OmpA-like peptidoglycan-associated protein